MKARVIAYTILFAAAAVVGHVAVKPASAATQLSVSLHAQPVHFGYHPPLRYYGPVPRFYPPGHFAPRYYYGPRTPPAYWQWQNHRRPHFDRRYHHPRGNKHFDRRDRDRHDHRGRR